MVEKKRIGIFGWGVVAPKSPNVTRFRENLKEASPWLDSFEGFGPSNFLVGKPEFDFSVYKEWIDQRFEPRKYGQLDSKMGTNVKYAIGSFIQALGQNSGLEKTLQDLGTEAHIYVGTGLGDFPVQYELSLKYHRAQQTWNQFWCSDAHHSQLKAYYAASSEEKAHIRESSGAPQDPNDLDIRDPQFEEVRDAWFSHWVWSSEGLKNYLDELKSIEEEGLSGDVDGNKGHLIKRKMISRKRLNQKYGCPTEPWSSVDPKILWNIANIPGAQISMLGRITGALIAPIAACAGFGASLRLGINAIQLGQAKAAVIGTTDPEPHALTVGGFFGARVASNDGSLSRPFTEMKGTHVSGGSCVWIIGDYDYFSSLGMKPLGMEILGVGVTSDADHIITPSEDGPRNAIALGLNESEIQPTDISTWDMHATATPGDWTELQNALSVFSPNTRFTARKGSFGHGMSACGGWELTAQHLGVEEGVIYPVNLEKGQVNPDVANLQTNLVTEGLPFDGTFTGKINMGVGGVNSCVICKKWS